MPSSTAPSAKFWSTSADLAATSGQTIGAAVSSRTPTTSHRAHARDRPGSRVPLPPRCGDRGGAWSRGRPSRTPTYLPRAHARVGRVPPPRRSDDDGAWSRRSRSCPRIRRRAHDLPAADGQAAVLDGAEHRAGRGEAGRRPFGRNLANPRIGSAPVRLPLLLSGAALLALALRRFAAGESAGSVTSPLAWCDVAVPSAEACGVAEGRQ
jgi:hypothetical protein